MPRKVQGQVLFYTINSFSTTGTAAVYYQPNLKAIVTYFNKQYKEAVFIRGNYYKIHLEFFLLNTFDY